MTLEQFEAMIQRNLEIGCHEGTIMTGLTLGEVAALVAYVRACEAWMTTELNSNLEPFPQLENFKLARKNLGLE